MILARGLARIFCETGTQAQAWVLPGFPSLYDKSGYDLLVGTLQLDIIATLPELTALHILSVDIDAMFDINFLFEQISPGAFKNSGTWHTRIADKVI